MKLPPLPHPVYHIVSQGELVGYMSAEQMQAYGQACYEKALLEAMNATLPFGKTGAVIAAAIGALK